MAALDPIGGGLEAFCDRPAFVTSVLAPERFVRIALHVIGRVPVPEAVWLSLKTRTLGVGILQGRKEPQGIAAKRLVEQVPDNALASQQQFEDE